MRGGKRLRLTGLLIAAVMCAAAAQIASAAVGPKAYTLVRSSSRSVQIKLPQRHDALVSRMLSEQPVHEHLVEVKVTGVSVWVDLHKNYAGQGFRRIDQNHMIPASMRLARSAASGHAYTIWGKAKSPSEQVHRVEPWVILRKLPPPPTPLLVVLTN